VAVHIIDAVLLPTALPAAAPAPAPTPAAEEEAEEEAEEPAAPTPVETYRIYNSVVGALSGEGLGLLAAVNAADLDGALGASFNGTVFVPSNEASS
jgi:uncharacterized surface protein with fasciclin (FAS1) repeats